MRRIPNRWLEYSKCGKPVKDLPIFACKTPLERNPNVRHKRNVQCAEEEFTPSDLVKFVTGIGYELSAVVDLTNTYRYYNGVEEFVKKHNVQYEKVKCEGHAVPNNNVVESVANIISEVIYRHGKDSRKLVGIHCTHGVNRTGYIIARYMIEWLGYEPTHAIEAVNISRGHVIERAVYLEGLNAISPSRRFDEWKKDRCVKGTVDVKPEIMDDGLAGPAVVGLSAHASDNVAENDNNTLVCSGTQKEGPTKPVKLCQFYKKYGKCRFEDKCKFLHIWNANEKEIKLCRFYKKHGKCKFGDKCRFLHNVNGESHHSQVDAEETMDSLDVCNSTNVTCLEEEVINKTGNESLGICHSNTDHSSLPEEVIKTGNDSLDICNSNTDNTYLAEASHTSDNQFLDTCKSNTEEEVINKVANHSIQNSNTVYNNDIKSTDTCNPDKDTDDIKSTDTCNPDKDTDDIKTTDTCNPDKDTDGGIMDSDAECTVGTDNSKKGNVQEKEVLLDTSEDKNPYTDGVSDT